MGSSIVTTWPERMDDTEAAADCDRAVAHDRDVAVSRFVAAMAAHPEWP